MELQTSKALSDAQQFRYELLQRCGNVEDAEKANTFVMGKDEKPVQAQLPKSGIEDGIYLVHVDGKATLFEPEYTKDDNMDNVVVAIGLKMGSFGIKIALRDEASGNNIALTTKVNGYYEENDQAYYADNYDDAVADMDGARNTNHLRNILNPQIKLADDWYIPSLGELYRIFINKKAINAALEFAGGNKLQDCRYWTSTEFSAIYAWYLYLPGGMSNWFTKYSYMFKVRAVSAFIF